jgi:hypothetical protein
MDRMSIILAPGYDEEEEHTVRPGDIPGRNCASIRLASSISLRVLFFRLPLGHSQVTFDFLHACYQQFILSAGPPSRVQSLILDLAHRLASSCGESFSSFGLVLVLGDLPRRQVLYHYT